MAETKRNPAWTRDELLLALDYYLDHRRDYFAPTHEAVVSLANKIRQVALALGLRGNENFRNADGVSMKLLNFRAHDPEHLTKGLQRGNKLEKVVWDEFSNRPNDLKKVVSTILRSLDGSESEKDAISHEVELVEAEEGRVLTRLHSYRERDRSIIKKKKSAFLKEHGRLFCEACGFDFQKVYGDRGVGFIECHHTKPVSELKAGERTKIAELILLCGNCHRMVHAARPWWTFEELVASLRVECK